MDNRRYLARIGFGGAPGPDLSTLRALHRLHVAAIPFENLDVQMDVPIRLDPVSLHDKLVLRRRGGYCFEQNTWFQHVLEGLGLAVIACEARVRQGGSGVRPRTHMVLVAATDGLEWLCDVGFGGSGLIEPVAMRGSESRQGAWTYRVAPEGGLRVLQRRDAGAWEDLYAFEPSARNPIDFEMANWFTSTWPDSPFVRHLTVQRSSVQVRQVLRNLTYSEERGADIATRELPREALVPLLRDTFGLDIDTNARFRALDP